MPKVAVDTNNLSFISYQDELECLRDPDAYINGILRALVIHRDLSAERSDHLRAQAKEINALKAQIDILVKANARADRLEDVLAAVLPLLMQIVDAHNLNNHAMERVAVQELASVTHDWIVGKLTPTT